MQLVKAFWKGKFKNDNGGLLKDDKKHIYFESKFHDEEGQAALTTACDDVKLSSKRQSIAPDV